MPRIRTKYKIAASLIIGASLFAIAESLVIPSPKPDYYGSLVKADPESSIPVDVKANCQIAAFGVAPWLKPGAPRTGAWDAATLKALAAMGMPADAAAAGVNALRAGGGEPVGMGDTHGVSTIYQFIYYPTFHTTYRIGERYSVCRDSRTNFQNAHRMEYAIVYRIKDSSGYMWHVGEFLACGNVSLFNPAPKGWLPGVPYGSIVGTGNNVPEPSTLVLFAIAFTVLIGKFYKRK